MEKTNYLIIDLGNTCIKAAVFDIKQNKILETQKVDQTNDAKKLIDTFNCIKSGLKIDMIVESLTAKPEISREFNESLAKIIPAEIKITSHDDFKELMDLSNFPPTTIIGTDILALAYYGMKTLTKGAIGSLGTIYFFAVFDKDQIQNVLFVPSLITGLKAISSSTSIDAESIPETFDKTIGLSTSDAFSAGANLIMEGMVDSIVKEYALASFNILLTGGDARKYSRLTKKYKVIDNLVLTALTMVIKAKKW